MVAKIMEHPKFGRIKLRRRDRDNSFRGVKSIYDSPCPCCGQMPRDEENAEWIRQMRIKIEKALND